MPIAHVTRVAASLPIVVLETVATSVVVSRVVACPRTAKQRRSHVSERARARLQGSSGALSLTASPLLALSVGVTSMLKELPLSRSQGDAFAGRAVCGPRHREEVTISESCFQNRTS